MPDAVEVSEFSESLCYHVLHQPLRPGRQVVEAERTICQDRASLGYRQCTSVFPPPTPEGTSRRSSSDLYLDVLYTSVSWRESSLLLFSLVKSSVSTRRISSHTSYVGNCRANVGVGLPPHLLDAGRRPPHPSPAVKRLLLGPRQALEPRHSLLCNDGPPFGGVLNAIPQQMGHIVVGPDPSLLGGWTETLDAALLPCRVAAESAGRQWHLTPLRAHLCSTALQGNAPAMDWSTQLWRSSSPPVPCPVCSDPGLAGAARMQ